MTTINTTSIKVIGNTFLSFFLVMQWIICGGFQMLKRIFIPAIYSSFSLWILIFYFAGFELLDFGQDVNMYIYSKDVPGFCCYCCSVFVRI